MAMRIFFKSVPEKWAYWSDKPDHNDSQALKTYSWEELRKLYSYELEKPKNPVIDYNDDSTQHSRDCDQEILGNYKNPIKNWPKYHVTLQQWIWLHSGHILKVWMELNSYPVMSSVGRKSRYHMTSAVVWLLMGTYSQIHSRIQSKKMSTYIGKESENMYNRRQGKFGQNGCTW